MTFTEISELVIPAAALFAVASLFLSSKKEDTQPEQPLKKSEPVVTFTKDATGLTGVAKYLAQQAAEIAALAATQVEETVAQPVVSRVAKYLEERDRTPVSGVTKYTLRQAIAQKQAKQNTVVATKLTGVDKYLKTQKPAPVLSGVAKYLKHQESLPQPSKVAKYMAKQAINAKQNRQPTATVELTGVAKYLKHQDSLPQPSRVEKYMAKQAILAKQAKKAQVPVVVTGVAKYLTQQESLPKTSRVAKYITRQNLTAKQTPVVVKTGVEKYLRSQNQ